MIETAIVALIVLTAGWYSFKSFRKAAANDGGCSGSCGCSTSSPAHISKFADLSASGESTSSGSCGCGCGCSEPSHEEPVQPESTSGGCGCGCGCS